MKEKKSLYAPKRISHGEAIFHARSALHKSVRISFVEKKKQTLSHLLPFFWCRRWDCRRAACVRPCQSGCADACLLGVSRISPGGFSSSPHSKKTQHPQMGTVLFGAGGGTRTHMMLPSADFESATSTNSITPAYSLP